MFVALLRRMAFRPVCPAKPRMQARPLLGMPLTTLDLNYTYAKDLWPLRNMPLERLRALTGHENGEVSLWDLASKKKLTTFRQHKHQISSVAFSPDGRYALSGENNQGGSAMWLYRLPSP